MRCWRVLLFGLVIVMIHRADSARRQRELLEPPTAVAIEDIADLFPGAAKIVVSAGDDGLQRVFGPQGEHIGSFVRTSPMADDVIGFCGPTDTLLAFDREGRIVDIKILSSQDTRDHVAQIRDEVDFLASLRGLSRSEAAGVTEVDGVAGATLTSVAIQEGILLRLGGGEVSLRFPGSLDLQDVQALFPDATRVQKMAAASSQWHVLAKDGAVIGSLLRTSPASDAIVGYQGPSDTLVGFDSSGLLTGLRLLKTYDNEEYAVHLREDDYFPSQFTGLTLAELGLLEPRVAEIDGVSGATLISTAVTEGMILAAKRASAPPRPWLDWQARDYGTAIVVLLGAVIGLSRLRTRKRLRVVFLGVLVGYLGFINADLLSAAQLAGWAQNGIPWRSAGGLFLLTLAAFLIPVVAKRNVYCSHLCPHGALQQLLRGRITRQLSIPAPLARGLRLVPFVLLVVCLVVTMTGGAFSLVDLEPFDAWVLSVAAWPTVSIAVVGLLASCFVPMAYCRYGCPTGAVLRFLAHSDGWSRRDSAATALVGLAFVLSM